MYNFKFLDNEKIELIMDDVLVFNTNKLYTFIVTNMRLLILDYPSAINNSMEDLRISGRINYVRMKEIVFEIKLGDIDKIRLSKDKVMIEFDDNKELTFRGKEIYNILKKKM